MNPSANVAATAGPADMSSRAHEAAALLRALAHPDRLLLLCQLVEGESPVTPLGERAGIAQPSLSQQLGVLRAERLVATRREGKQVVYRIASPAAMAVLEVLYRHFCPPAPAATPDQPPAAANRTARRPAPARA